MGPTSINRIATLGADCSLVAYFFTTFGTIYECHNICFLLLARRRQTITKKVEPSMKESVWAEPNKAKMRFQQ